MYSLHEDIYMKLCTFYNLHVSISLFKAYKKLKIGNDLSNKKYKI